MSWRETLSLLSSADEQSFFDRLREAPRCGPLPGFHDQATETSQWRRLGWLSRQALLRDRESVRGHAMSSGEVHLASHRRTAYPSLRAVWRYAFALVLGIDICLLAAPLCVSRDPTPPLHRRNDGVTSHVAISSRLLLPSHCRDGRLEHPDTHHTALGSRKFRAPTISSLRTRLQFPS